MAVNWRVDEGLAVLIAQWKREHPGAVVGTIGDASHLSHESEHNPEPAGAAPGADKGEVDAGDFMPGNGVSMEDLAELRADLLRARDARLLLVIFKQVIVSSVVQPWKPRTYRGKYHGHLHVSVNDRFDRNTAPWDLGEDEIVRNYTMVDVPGRLPELQVGDEDVPGKVQHVSLAQSVLNGTRGAGLDIDGVYGPGTAAAVAKAMAGDAARTTSNGAKIHAPEWKRLYGIW